MSDAPQFEMDGTVGPIRGDVFNAEHAKGTVIICHGFKGFAHWGFFPHLAQQLATAGFNAITFDFSGNGVGPDRESFSEEERFTSNTFTAELKDLELVIAYARSRKLIEKRFGLLGHSRGGGMAILHTASDPDVAALVTWASLSHLRRWGDAEAEQWRRRGFAEVTNSRTGQVLKLGVPILEEVESQWGTTLNVEAAASRVRTPWLILHGIADETLKPTEAERLHASSKGTSTLRILEGSHSFDAKHPLSEVPPALEKATAETVSFFARHLAGA